MSSFHRRDILCGLGATTLLAACGNGIGSKGATQIDARVDATRDYLFNTYPGTRSLSDQAAGILFMPLVTEAGLGFGGAFGRGALRVRGVTVDYYSSAKATFGQQIGAQQYAHARFFMTEAPLGNFCLIWGVGGVPARILHHITQDDVRGECAVIAQANKGLLYPVL